LIKQTVTRASSQDLARAAKKDCKIVVSSIFVNSKQFAPHEDFASYPRQQEQDIKKLEEAGVDMVFFPDQDMMYPEGYDTYITCDVGSGRNEGAVRPHFFRGKNIQFD
jgi:pantoate--beta-alanine ligase